MNVLQLLKCFAAGSVACIAVIAVVFYLIRVTSKFDEPAALWLARHPAVLKTARILGVTLLLVMVAVLFVQMGCAILGVK